MTKFILIITFLLIKEVDAANKKSAHNLKFSLIGVCRMFDFGWLSRYLTKNNLILLFPFKNFSRSWDLNKLENLWSMVKELSLDIDTFSVNKHSRKKYTKLALLGSNFWNQLVIYPESKGRLLGFGKYLGSLVCLYSEGIMPLSFSVVIPSWYRIS